MSSDSEAGSRSDEEILEEYFEALERADSGETESIRQEFRRRYPRRASVFDFDALLSGKGIDPNWGRPLVERIAGGRYSFRAVLGVGGMGCVYRVFDSELKREVALKMIKADRWAEHSAESKRWEQDRRRFLREVEAMRQVAHPNVMAVLESGTVDGHPYLVMDILNGPTLKQYLNENREKHGKCGLPPAVVAQLGEEVANGLAALHEREMVHRDVKPSNIGLVTGNQMRRRRAWLYQALLMDLGLVRFEKTAPNSPSMLTLPNTLVGTIRYMAPEQVKGEPSPRSDLFSLGCVLYEAATGQRPFDGPSNASILIRIGGDDPEPPRKINPEIPAALSRYIMRLLQKKPDKRPRDAKVVANDLIRIRRQMGLIGLLRRVLSATWRAMMIVWELTHLVERLAASAKFRKSIRMLLVGGTAAVLLLTATFGVLVLQELGSREPHQSSLESYPEETPSLNPEAAPNAATNSGAITEPDPLPDGVPQPKYNGDVVVKHFQVVRDQAAGAASVPPNRDFSIQITLMNIRSTNLPPFRVRVKASRDRSDRGAFVIGEREISALRAGDSTHYEILCRGLSRGNPLHDSPVWHLELAADNNVVLDYDWRGSQILRLYVQ